MHIHLHACRCTPIYERKPIPGFSLTGRCILQACITTPILIMPQIRTYIYIYIYLSIYIYIYMYIYIYILGSPPLPRYPSPLPVPAPGGPCSQQSRTTGTNPRKPEGGRSMENDPSQCFFTGAENRIRAGTGAPFARRKEQHHILYGNEHVTMT